MRKLLAGEKSAYHLQDYAILENKDGAYDYMAWDFETEKPSRIRGEAIILGEVLGLTSITSEGQEESIETLLELKYELHQLPAWDKTKYYCVITQPRYGSLLKYCDTGNFVMKGSQEYEMVQEKLAAHGVTIFSQSIFSD